MEEKRKSTRWGIWLVLGPILLVIVYSLSIGPVCCLLRKGFIADEYAQCAIHVFYLPLGCLTENNVQPFANWLVRYIDLWEMLPPH